MQSHNLRLVFDKLRSYKNVDDFIVCCKMLAFLFSSSDETSDDELIVILDLLELLIKEFTIKVFPGALHAWIYDLTLEFPPAFQTIIYVLGVADKRIKASGDPSLASRLTAIDQRLYGDTASDPCFSLFLPDPQKGTIAALETCGATRSLVASQSLSSRRALLQGSVGPTMSSSPSHRSEADAPCFSGSSALSRSISSHAPLRNSVNDMPGTSNARTNLKMPSSNLPSLNPPQTYPFVHESELTLSESAMDLLSAATRNPSAFFSSFDCAPEVPAQPLHPIAVQHWPLQSQISLQNPGVVQSSSHRDLRSSASYFDLAEFDITLPDNIMQLLELSDAPTISPSNPGPRVLVQPPSPCFPTELTGFQSFSTPFFNQPLETTVARSMPLVPASSSTFRDVVLCADGPCSHHISKESPREQRLRRTISVSEWVDGVTKAVDAVEKENVFFMDTGP